MYAAFEVSPQASSVITTGGKLLCSYPGPAIEIPNAVFNDAIFRSELANFLVCMNEDALEESGTPGLEDTAAERGDNPHPRHITELLTGILRGVGQPPASIARVTKRIGDDVIGSSASSAPWRRSSLWLFIRVAIQTTLEPLPQGHDSYKNFMIFFLARLTGEAIQADLSGDLLYFMSRKISRRLRKLGPLAPGWLAEAVLDTCGRVRQLLDARWEEVQAAQRASPLHVFSELDLARDIQLSLSCSHEYLAKCLRNHDPVPATPFQLENRPRGTLDNFLSSDGVFFTEAFRAEPHLTLYDVEFAVEQGIDAWVDSITNADAGTACVKLEVLASKYSIAASKLYANNPEQLSIMLLTMIELWVALDKVAVKETPLLEEYSPEIPLNILESLLLRKATNLRRLQLAHQYLSSRRNRSDPDLSVFSTPLSEDAFAVRYYDQSEHLQELERRIEEAAQHELESRLKELKKANQKHAKIKAESDGMHHTFVTVEGVRLHARQCPKCKLERQLNAMMVDVYEWPLPDDELRSATVMFELNCPLSFSMWRNVTFHFLISLCSQRHRGKRPFLLGDYTALQPYLVAHPRSRVTLAATSRPPHRKGLLIPATEDQIRVSNNLKFFGFDTQNNIHIANAFGDINVKRLCTHQLQDGPYLSLQPYVDGTNHSSNDVLASQADCHKDLSVHEFIAFGHLRSGGLIQWLNVLRELRDRSLTFRCPEIHLLVTQAIMQVGPVSSTEFRWHKELQENTFGHALVDELTSLVADVEANWLEGITMNTISLLVGRLLASDPDESISERAVELLRAVRTKVFSWVQELSDKLTRTPGDEELRGLLRDTAAICRSTFDVDLATARQLFDRPEDVEIILSCAILIHDNTPSNTSTLSPYSQLLVDRDRRLSYALECVLSDVVDADSNDEGIDLAVERIWSDYRPGSEWCPLPEPHSRWYLCTTASTTTQCSQAVYFNMLDGSLLVDGKPLGRLPCAVVQHPLYTLLFGKASVVYDARHDASC